MVASVDNLLRTSLAGSKARILALDPGETTGFCVFEGPNLVVADQLKTKSVPEGAWEIEKAVCKHNVAEVVMEMYRVYSWKAEDHSWQSLHTPRLIGAVEYVCFQLDVPLIQQTAQQAKGFCTDEKLKAWGVYQVGKPHSCDAIRHACYYLLFDVAKVHKPKGVK